MLVVILEIFGALINREPSRVGGGAGAYPATVVLVPAHNEEASIPVTLSSIRDGLPENSRILVVAHNCSDATARIARGAGVEVLEANDEGKGGKPDALKAGLSALDVDPPAVVVIIDADCRVEPGAIATLATAAHALNWPVMGAYTFSPADGSVGMATVSSLAILLKNFIRPLGLHFFELPCLLNGSGSAYPFELIRHAPHGEGSIAEDYQLTIDLLRRGYPTRFVPEAKIYTQLPKQMGTALKQRRRWEHGHLWLALSKAPVLLWEGIVKRNLDYCALALEVSVPPLGFLLLLWGGVLGLIVGLYPLHGQFGAMVTVLAGGLALIGMLVFSWLQFAGVSQTLSALASVPRYLLWKLPMYGAFFRRRETRWMKTERDNVAS
ncbi:glycosyltransferase [Methylococcus sp. EFPC2]|uniref:glycosyltransferase family 2 protein n=1 Tax=Methylococcus sp. EFPC2 TaxID=2812648 RepID=UPI001967653C|nr:glycosyltransferase [Methylococcus sp. EFPC2]QSA97294.1 glycosyltransferase [Methylococcus sp. EFPC2]